MGARHYNTPPSKSPGKVSEYPALTIAQLKEAGAFKGDARASWSSSWSRDGAVTLQRTCAIRLEEFGGRTVVILNPAQPNRRQQVRLVSKPMRYGGHRWWFLCPITGKPVEKLYCVGGAFASAKAHHLRYSSQSEGDLDRSLRKRDKLERRVVGDERRGPSRGGRRKAAEEDLSFIDQAIAARARHIALASTRRTAAAEARRKALEARLQAYAKALRATPTPATAAVVVTGLAGWLEPHRIKRRVSPDTLTRAARVPAAALADRGYLDTLLLAKLGYLKEGEITGDHLSWPKAWVPEPGRMINLLVDLRKTERPSALIIFEDPKDLHFQPLQLARMKGDFGRQELMFVCPKTKLATPVLVYAQGGFVSIEGLDPP